MNNHNIIIYSTPTCPYCVMAKQYFTERNIAYTDIDVSRDQIKAQEMITKSGQMAVPVIDIDGNILVGFQPKAFDAFLKHTPE